MSEPHLLRVDAGPEPFAALILALHMAGMRAGWLELIEPAAGPPLPLPPDLEVAAAAGVLRAVAAGGGRSIAVKPLKGAPALGDLLREHFRGCALVLVRGEAAVPHLTIDGGDWRVSPPGEAERRYATADLVAALRRPRPWT